MNTLIKNIGLIVSGDIATPLLDGDSIVIADGKIKSLGTGGVPANAPVKQYWSATVYDRATHALVKDMSRASRASNNTEVQKNADGSVEILDKHCLTEGAGKHPLFGGVRRAAVAA